MCTQLHSPLSVPKGAGPLLVGALPAHPSPPPLGGLPSILGNSAGLALNRVDLRLSVSCGDEATQALISRAPGVPARKRRVQDANLWGSPSSDLLLRTGPP